MKKLIVLIALVAGFAAYNPASAQLAVSVNISSQPMWGPVGYSYVEYYYLPEIDVFYYVPTGKFVYWNGFTWVFISTLPPRYHVDLFRTYKVVVNEPRPYLHHDVYVVKYQKYKASPPRQDIIRDSKDPKYDVVKNHPRNGTAGNTNVRRVERDNSGNSKVVKPNERVTKKVEKKTEPATRKSESRHKKNKNQ